MALIRSLSLDAPSSAHQGAGLVAARADWQRALDQAREEGRRLGREESAAAVRTAQAARERSEREVAALATAVQAIQDLRAQTLQEAEQDCLALALAVAARVLRREVAADGAWLAQVIAEVRDRLPPGKDLRLAVHPQDLEDLRKAGVKTPELIADPSLTRGSCRGESAGTRIDAGVATAWERCAEALLGIDSTTPRCDR